MTASGDFQLEIYLAGLGETMPSLPVCCADGYPALAGLTPDALRPVGARLG
jgi:hypothetical protein